MFLAIFCAQSFRREILVVQKKYLLESLVLNEGHDDHGPTYLGAMVKTRLGTLQELEEQNIVDLILKYSI